MTTPTPVPDLPAYITVTAVEPGEGLSLWLTFSDGTEGRAELGSVLRGEMFVPVKDPEFFQRVQVDPVSHTVVWPNGADLSPQFLYELVVRANAEVQHAVEAAEVGQLLPMFGSIRGSQLHYGDNLDVLRDRIPSESVDLVYLDPPFNSKRVYNTISQYRAG